MADLEQELGPQEYLVDHLVYTHAVEAQPPQSRSRHAWARLLLVGIALAVCLAGGAYLASWGSAPLTRSGDDSTIRLIGALPADFPVESLHPLGYDPDGRPTEPSQVPVTSQVVASGAALPGASSLDLQNAQGAAAEAAQHAQGAAAEAAQSAQGAAAEAAQSAQGAAAQGAIGMDRMKTGLATISSGIASKVTQATSQATQALSQVRLPSNLPMAGSSPVYSGPACGFTESGVTYPGNDYRTLSNIPNAGECCQACAEDPSCYAWTWGMTQGKDFSNKCWLKGNTPRPSISRVHDADFVSGLPSQVGRSIEVHDPSPGASLFCFSLVIPRSYEPEMLRLQYSLSTSIFNCDEMATYSNEEIMVAPGVQTIVVDTNLECAMGGEFGTALNNEIFMEVWKVVFLGGRYTHHDWTVKVDPDSVFMPDRLRAVVQSYAENPDGVYLNNCNKGLHGPAEVFSRNAVNKWAFGRTGCMSHFSQLCAGPCKWGEDMFIDQCLDKVLHVTRQYDPRILVEDHCDAPPDWRSCNTADTVAFHPFKTPEEYTTCFNNAMAASR